MPGTARRESSLWFGKLKAKTGSPPARGRQKNNRACKALLQFFFGISGEPGDLWMFMGWIPAFAGMTDDGIRRLRPFLDKHEAGCAVAQPALCVGEQGWFSRMLAEPVGLDG